MHLSNTTSDFFCSLVALCLLLVNFPALYGLIVSWKRKSYIGLDTPVWGCSSVQSDHFRAFPGVTISLQWHVLIVGLGLTVLTVGLGLTVLVVGLGLTVLMIGPGLTASGASNLVNFSRTVTPRNGSDRVGIS